MISENTYMIQKSSLVCFSHFRLLKHCDILLVLTIIEYTSRKSPRIHTLQIEMRQNLREVNNSDHTPIAGHAWIEGLYLQVQGQNGVPFRFKSLEDRSPLSKPGTFYLSTSRLLEPALLRTWVCKVIVQVTGKLNYQKNLRG